MVHLKPRPVFSIGPEIDFLDHTWVQKQLSHMNKHAKQPLAGGKKHKTACSVTKPSLCGKTEVLTSNPEDLLPSKVSRFSFRAPNTS